MLRQAASRAVSAVRSSHVPQLPPQGARGMAGGHGHGHGVEHGGLVLHPPARWHTNVATGMSALMWFWVLYRWKEDGATLLFGHAPHFEHEVRSLDILLPAGLTRIWLKLLAEAKEEQAAVLYKPHS